MTQTRTQPRIQQLKDHKTAVIVAALTALGVIAFLAFGVFGVHTLFIDEKVNEAAPVFQTAANAEVAVAEEAPAAEPAGAATAEPASTSEPAGDALVEPATAQPVVPEVIRAAEGSFVDHDHPGTGTAVILTDGVERFLRFEEDFETDNGPDLNVYLSAGVSADGDSGLFDDDFIDLGDLKGNIGAQNYEIPEGVDLDRYTTVVIWCVRFGVAFTAADLA